jgi:hypothetical protein
MISHDLYECSNDIIHSGDIQIITAIARLLKPFIVKYFCKITRRYIGKLRREDIRVLKNTFNYPKNCQNREEKLNYKTIGV